jgi:hypothetical protein
VKRTPFARRTTELRRGELHRRESSLVGTRPRAERLAGGNPIPTAARRAVRERSGGRCEIRSHECTDLATAQHHRKRRRDGGHGLGNLLDTCAPCHGLAHDQPAYARRRGWIVSAFEVNPSSVPVIYGPNRTWFGDDGSKTTEIPS